LTAGDPSTTYTSKWRKLGTDGRTLPTTSYLQQQKGSSRRWCVGRERESSMWEQEGRLCGWLRWLSSEFERSRGILRWLGVYKKVEGGRRRDMWRAEGGREEEGSKKVRAQRLSRLILCFWAGSRRYPKAEAVAVDLLPVEDRYVLDLAATEGARSSARTSWASARLEAHHVSFLSSFCSYVPPVSSHSIIIRPHRAQLTPSPILSAELLVRE